MSPSRTFEVVGKASATFDATKVMGRPKANLDEAEVGASWKAIVLFP